MVKRKLILHAGRHKTGTTSIQAFLSANDEVLLERYKILYPKSGREGNLHHPIFRQLIHERKSMDDKLVSQVVEEFDRSNAETLLLSSEMLSRDNVTVQDLKDIQSTFSTFSIVVVLYVRNQITFLRSTYAEQVKIGILKYPQSIRNLEYKLDHMAFLEKFRAVFGAKALRIGVYKDSPEFNINIDFCRQIGLSDGGELSLPSTRYNKRYPWGYIELLRFANTNQIARRLVANRTVSSIARSLGNMLPSVFDRPHPISRDQSKLINQKYNESNKKIAQIYLNKENLFE